MRIGIDVDGVIINFEKELKTHAELFNMLELKKDQKTKRNEMLVHNRHEWSEEENKKFVDKYFLELSERAAFLPGAVDVIKMLKEEGHYLVVVSARGGIVAEMKDVALKKLNQAGLEFDDYYFQQKNKVEVCKKCKFDFMIDDSYDHAKALSTEGIRVIYFRDVDMPILEENEFLYDATNWGEVYKILRTKA